jgi:hypothetical protein
MDKKISDEDMGLINDALNSKKAIGKTRKKIDSLEESKIVSGSGLYNMNGMKIKAYDFSGKKLKHDKSTWKRTGQIIVKKGTKWEEIPKYITKQINFNEQDFV